MHTYKFLLQRHNCVWINKWLFCKKKCIYFWCGHVIIRFDNTRTRWCQWGSQGGIGNARENPVNDWSANPFNIEVSVINEIFADSDCEEDDFEGFGEDMAMTVPSPMSWLICTFLALPMGALMETTLWYVQKVPLDKKSALLQTMAWCWIGDKP